jgi:hypothetical protein
MNAHTKIANLLLLLYLSLKYMHFLEAVPFNHSWYLFFIGREGKDFRIQSRQGTNIPVPAGCWSGELIPIIVE